MQNNKYSNTTIDNLVIDWAMVAPSPPKQPPTQAMTATAATANVPQEIQWNPFVDLQLHPCQ